MLPLPSFGCTAPVNACYAWEPSIATAPHPKRAGEEVVVVAFITSGFSPPPSKRGSRSQQEFPPKRIGYAYGIRDGPGRPVRWKAGRALAPCDNEGMVSGANPSVASGPDGTFYCVALVDTHPITLRVFKSSWYEDDLIFLPVSRAFDFDGKPWIVVDNSRGPGRGTIYLSFTAKEPGGTCPLCQFTRSTDGGVTWLPQIRLPLELGCHTRMAVGPNSELYIAGHICGNARCPDGSGFHVLRTTDAYSEAPHFSEYSSGSINLDGEWSGMANGCPNSKTLGQPWIGCDTGTGPYRGSVYLLCSVDPPGPDPLDVMFSSRRNDAAAWAPPLRLNGGNLEAWQWFGAMSVAPNGRIDAVWNESLDSKCTTSQLFYAYRGTQTPVPQWSRPVPVSNPWTMGEGWHLGGYYHMVSDDDGADLAWARVGSGPCGLDRNVYYLRIDASTARSMDATGGH